MNLTMVAILLHITCNLYVYNREPGVTEKELKSFLRLNSGTMLLNAGVVVAIGLCAILQDMDKFTLFSEEGQIPAFLAFMLMAGLTGVFATDNFFRLLKYRVPVNTVSKN